MSAASKEKFNTYYNARDQIWQVCSVKWQVCLFYLPHFCPFDNQKERNNKVVVFEVKSSPL